MGNLQVRVRASASTPVTGDFPTVLVLLTQWKPPESEGNSHLYRMSPEHMFQLGALTPYSGDDCESLDLPSLSVPATVTIKAVQNKTDRYCNPSSVHPKLLPNFVQVNSNIQVKHSGKYKYKHTHTL